MAGFKLYFFILASVLYITNSYAAVGSIADLSLSVSQTEEDQDFRISQNTFKTKLSRNIRFNKEHFLDINWNENFLDTLFIQNDLVLTRTVADGVPILKKFSYFRDINAFFALGYKRMLYTNEQTIKESCWNQIICLSDMHLGFFKPFIKTNRFYSEKSLSFKLPVSKRSIKDSFLLGIEAALDTTYELLLHPLIHLDIFSSHNIDLNFYVYQTSHKNRDYYNIPLASSHQVGIHISTPNKFPLMPALFLSSNYQFAINFNGTPFHLVSLDASSIWSVEKKINLVASIQWSDYVLQNQHSALPVHTQIFNPDKTFVSLGFSYIF